MHIATLAQVRIPDSLYRCDSMPLGRAYAYTAEGSDLYIKLDGATEPFNFRLESDKYKYDETWERIGTLPRLAPDGRFNLQALFALLNADASKQTVPAI